MIYRLQKEYFVRALRESDLNGPYPSWFEDQEVCAFSSHGKYFRTLEFFRKYIDSTNSDDRIVWAICHDNDGHIGNVTLQGISIIHRSAEFAIILGDRRHWGRGVGAMAGRQLLEHGFDKLNLERVYCGTAESNRAMIKLAKTLGMRLEGTRRQHFFLNGAREDMLEFGVLRSEFKGF